MRFLPSDIPQWRKVHLCERGCFVAEFPNHLSLLWISCQSILSGWECSANQIEHGYFKKRGDCSRVPSLRITTFEDEKV
eukprot:scaffold48175_cov58-Cyclotella_meneghiniana.AAC.4